MMHNTATIDIAPTPFQARVLSLPLEWDLLLDGGRGGGKTYAVILEVFRRAEQWGAQSRTLITRRTQGALSELEHELLSIFRLRYGTAARHNANEHVFRLPNGAYVELRNLESHKDLLPLQGKSFDCIVAEEVGQYADLSMFDFLRGCLRSASGVPCRFIMTANPGGPGHAVIAKRFIFGRPAWAPVTDPVSGRTYIRCPSKLTDNPRLPSEYGAQLAAIAKVDPGLAQAWIDGDWTAVAGDYFGGVFDEARNIVAPPDPADRPFSRPVDWAIRYSCDWGTTAPAVVLFAGISPGAEVSGTFMPKGSFFIFDEVHTAYPDDLNRGTRAPVSEVAADILETLARWRIPARRASGILDCAQFASQASDQAAVSDLFRREGVHFWPSVKGRRTLRLPKLRELMQAAGSGTRPGLYVSARCAYFLNTVPYLGRSQRNPEDCQTDGPDHALDACSYLVSTDPPRLIRRVL